MTSSQHLAKGIRDLYDGINWTGVTMKETLEGITWKQAITKVSNFNTIATLVFHTNYYIAGMITYIKGGNLDVRDAFSFNTPEILNQEAWEELVRKSFNDAETFAKLVESLPEDKLSKTFDQERYGDYHRNIMGAISHTHYHMGQIAFLKKMIKEL